MVKNFIIDVSEAGDVFSKNIRVEFTVPYAEYDGRDYYQLLWGADGSKVGMIVIEENDNFFSLNINKVLSDSELTLIYIKIIAAENNPKARAEDFHFSLNEFENSKLMPFSIMMAGARKTRKAKNTVYKTVQLAEDDH